MMMYKKYLVCLVVWLLSTLAVKAQQLERVVMNTTGGSFTTSSVGLDFNLGEVNVKVYNTPNFMLSEGFLQPNAPVPTALEDYYKALGFSYYPNPASIYFQLNSEVPQQIRQVVFYDMSGKMAQKSTFSNSFLDISTLQDGMYLVQALDQNGIAVHSFRLLKQ